MEDAIRAGEGLIAAEGPLVVRTGKHTGRSPQDKFIVDEPSSSAKIWWARSTTPSVRRTTTVSAAVWSRTAPRRTCTARTS